MNRWIILTAAFIFSLNLFSSDQDQKFLTILDSEWQRSIDDNPLYASYMGDKSSNQDWPDISEASLRKRQQKTRDTLEKIRKINPETLTEANRLNHRLFLYNYERSVRGTAI